jgi:hypothetical protein
MAKFHSMNAHTTTIDGVEIFYSYYTPVAFNMGGVLMLTARKFSSTTTRQVNRYVRDTWEKTHRVMTIPNDEFKRIISKYTAYLGLL